MGLRALPSVDFKEDVLVYEKWEADQYIEKIKQAARTLRKKMDHEKYKHCWSMAQWCNSECGKLAKTRREEMNDKQRWREDSGYWYKWRKIWWNLSEKFRGK